MDVLTLCGCALLCVVILFYFKQIKSEFYLPLSIALGFIILGQALMALTDKQSLLTSLFENTPMKNYGKTLLKAFGIAITVESTSDFCRDAGEASLASKIELIGKLQLLFLSLPLIEKILGIIKELI